MFDPNYEEAYERRRAFNEALDKLLLDHGAELSITEDDTEDTWPTYAITVTMDSVDATWDNPLYTKAFTEFNLDI